MMKNTHIRQVFARKFTRRGFLISLLVALLLLLAIFTTLGSFPLEGSSMEPTAHDGQSVIKIKAAYWFGDPQRGDVITFEHPIEHHRLIKRVIALPGEWVEVTSDYVYINDEPLVKTTPYTPALKCLKIATL